MRLRLAHYRNLFSMFRIYNALRVGLIKEDGIELEIVGVPDPPSRELEECLIQVNLCGSKRTFGLRPSKPSTGMLRAMMPNCVPSCGATL